MYTNVENYFFSCSAMVSSDILIRGSSNGPNKGVVHMMEVSWPG